LEYEQKWNKKNEKILKRNFLTLELNEFRTSIIENKSGLKCENLIKKMDYKKMSIKEIYNLEKLKEKNWKKKCLKCPIQI